MTTAGVLGQFEVTPSQLIRALKDLAPGLSAIVVGLHGIGKSEIVAALADHLREQEPEHDWPFFDKRLAQMTEGDMVGLPDRGEIDKTGVTKFLPVDWFYVAHREPAVLLLDELNRAELQIVNSGFQVIGARELNGLRLHPKSRVLACVNPPTFYQVNELDPALMDRFAVFHLRSSHEDWLAWARGRLDDTLVDFIHEEPQLLHVKPSELGQLEVGPTPRSWAKLSRQLRHADMAPSKVAGRPTPDLFPIFCHSLVGTEAANRFVRWVRDRKQTLSVEDVLDRWHEPAVLELARSLRHEEHLAAIDRIGHDSGQRTWTPKQAANVVAYSQECLDGEDKVFLFAKLTQGGRLDNIKQIHASQITEQVVHKVNQADDIGKDQKA